MTEILVADIGGTNSRFALFRAGHEGLAMTKSIWLPTAESHSFADLLDRLRQEGFPVCPGEPEATVLAVAGPVRGGMRCDPPNINWDIDLERDLDRKLSGVARVFLINDFVAQAFACRTRAVEGARIIQAGQPEQGRAVAVIGAGTGLGHCALVPHAGGYAAVSSEAGHADFPFRDKAERDYERFVRSVLHVDHCQMEDVVSGSGLALIHKFHTGKEMEPAEVAAGLDDASPTLEWFARFYGRAARLYVLNLLALAGLYITGGVAAKTPSLVTCPAFLEEFRNCRDYADLLSAVPVHLNANQESGLYGAALYGRQALAVRTGGTA
ncbi:MAG: glucokinase [Desulfovibrionaceae bacterium]